MIEQALYEHLQDQEALLPYLATYASKMAIFNQEAPADTDPLWGSGPQYGRIVFAVDLQGDPERTMGGMLAGMFIGMGLPLVAYDKIQVANEAGQLVSQDVLNGKVVAICALVFSLLAVLCYLLAYKLITERVAYQAEEKTQKVSVGKMLASALKNRALISIIVASVVMLLAQLTMQNMAAYLYPDYYNAAAMQSASSLLILYLLAMHTNFPHLLRSGLHHP